MKWRMTSISLTSGKSFDAFAAVVRAERFARVHGRHVERRQFECALARRRLLEDQPFVLIDVARAFLILSFILSVESVARSRFDTGFAR